MNRHSKGEQIDRTLLREKLIGLGERSFRKSYYPQLQQQVQALEEKSIALQNALKELENEHRKTEKEHRTAEENQRKFEYLAQELQTVFQSMTDAVVICDAQGVPRRANPPAIQAYGFNPVGLGHEQISRLVSIQNPDHTPVSFDDLLRTRALRGEVIENQQCLMTNANGATIFFRASASPFFDPEGNLWGIVIVWHDISDLKRIEAVLRESQDRLLLITHAGQVGLWEWDYHSDILTWDERCKALFGLPADSAVSFPIFRQLIHPDDRDHVDAMIQSALEQKTLFEDEFRSQRLDGSIHWIYMKGQVVNHHAGTLHQMVGVALDITQRKEVEKEIQANMARIEAQHRLMDQREQERQQIARDLHDGPVQELTAATFALRGILMECGSAELTRQLEEVQTMLQKLIHELRTYASELRPPTLVKFGLVEAIQSHIEHFRERHPEMHIDFENSGGKIILPKDIRLAVFRIYQEAMTNIEKHARATEVSIAVRSTGIQVIMEIRDNGAGFDLPEDWLELARDRHFGLVGIRERAEAVGGKVSIVTKRGEGTRLTVRVPLNSNPS